MTGATASSLPGTLHLGAVHLTVTDLDRSVAFYRDALGLSQHGRDEARAALGAGGEDLLVLHEDPDAVRAGGHAGVYHYALLYPARADLARALVRLSATGARVQGMSDHGISEAIYLPDPDGIGIELAADRPRERWPDLSIPLMPQPLDAEALLATATGEQATGDAPAGLVVGHVHLHVGDLRHALAFYRDALGFELMTSMPGALFLAAGGYHHHVAVNTWRGEGVPPQPDAAVGLRHWTVRVGDDGLAAVRERLAAGGLTYEDSDGALLVRDPWNIALRVTP